ncbi:MAG: MarC family protein [Coxiellaceae bacterium]|nr:MarC family protein [Coxiellaceae bacterium]
MLQTFTNAFLYAFIAVFPIINPIAMASVFYNMTQHGTPAQREKLARQVAIYGTILLLATLIVGPFILKFFGLQAADIRVAGGLVVFSIAWKMLANPGALEKKPDADLSSGNDIMSLAFFPLTMPLTAGAGSIAIVIALATQAKDTIHKWHEYLSIALAIIAIFVIVYFCYRYSDAIFKMLGKTGEKAVSSLSAFILLAISVSVIWSGIQMLMFPLMK